MRDDQALTAIFLTTEYPGGATPCGGIGYHFQKLARESQARGHDITVICLDAEDSVSLDQGVKLIRTVFRPGPIARLLLSILGFIGLRRYLRNLLTSRHLADAARRTAAFDRADLVIYQSYMLAGFFRIAEKPALCLLASCQYLCDIAGEPVKRFYPSELATAFTEFLLLRRMDVSFAPSRFVANFASRIARTPVANLETPYVPFPNPRNGELPAELKGKRILLYFGTLNRLKGVDRFAPIAREVLARHEDIVLVFCGKDPAGTLQYLAPVYEAAGANRDQIVRYDHLGQDVLRTLILEADHVILPSRTDNCPQTCIESMGLGAIVLGTEEAGFDQVIDHGETGFLTPQDDDAALVSAVEQILALGSEERARIQAAARARAHRMRPEITIPAFLDLCRDTIRIHGRKQLRLTR